MSKSRLITLLFSFIGFTLFIWLFIREDITDIFAVLSIVKWKLFWIAGYRIIPITIDAFGWLKLFEKEMIPRFSNLVLARWISEAFNTLLPVAQIGGHFLRAKLIGKNSVDRAKAGATVVVDFTIGLATQILFTVTGLILLIQESQKENIHSWIVMGIVAGLVALSGFILVQRAGLFAIGVKSVNLLLRSWKTTDLIGSARNLDQHISGAYSRKNKLVSCGFWRLAGWIAKSGEIWLFFYFVGSPVTIQEALVLESLSTAFRSAAFAIPGGLGVQDGGILFIGVMIGLSPEEAFALALAKRFREIVVGVPGLIWWFVVEGRQASPQSTGK
ncbi:MAG: flippase-like domain-containing protein [Deltaproteobacteria bacterium]|nr:flippase-like domain-containing protein [Deltaproteobacteria bacterium]